MAESLAKRNGVGSKWQQASSLNRSYQQALVEIRDSIKNPSDKTRLAILKAEDIAFEIEQKIGRESRSVKPVNAQCIHHLECVHYKIK
jgi:hypothetical protein